MNGRHACDCTLIFGIPPNSPRHTDDGRIKHAAPACILRRARTMTTELSPEKDKLLEKFVADGRFPNRQVALDRAVELLREEADVVDDIREGLASIERGEWIPLDEAVRGLRTKHGIAEDA